VPQNLELKARIHSLPDARRVAASLGARRRPTLEQVDTYFEVPEGRLKLRETGGKAAQLIYYDRASVPGTRGRWSTYLIYPVRNARTLSNSLTRDHGLRSLVRKRRELYLLDDARIHLDSVAGLGTFLEFEVIETSGRDQARRQFQRLRKAFGVKTTTVVAGSYADMSGKLLRRKRSLRIF
jgi:adenylate cyclase class IV